MLTLYDIAVACESKGGRTVLWEINPKLAKLEALATEIETAQREIEVCERLGVYNTQGMKYIVDRMVLMYKTSKKMLDILSKERYGKADQVVKEYYSRYNPSHFDMRKCYSHLANRYIKYFANNLEARRRFGRFFEENPDSLGFTIPLGYLKEVYENA